MNHSVILLRSGSRGQLPLENANRAWSRAASREWSPRKATASDNRKEEKQRQKLLAGSHCTKEGGDPRAPCDTGRSTFGEVRALSADPSD